MLVFGMSSCEDYLDVNTDPDNPVLKPYHRSFACRGYRTIMRFTHGGTASMRTITRCRYHDTDWGTAANSLLSSWNPAQSSCTTIYQNFYLGAGVNIDPLIEKAERKSLSL